MTEATLATPATETEPEKKKRGRKKVSIADFAKEIPELYEMKGEGDKAKKVLKKLTKTDFPYDNPGQNAFCLYMVKNWEVKAQRALTKKDPIKAKQDQIKEMQDKIKAMTADLASMGA